MPSVDAERLKQLGKDIQEQVAPILESANELIPNVRELDQTLMVSVDPSLAVAHALAGGYMIEMIQGAGECFADMSAALEQSAKGWEDADGTTASEFK